MPPMNLFSSHAGIEAPTMAAGVHSGSLFPASSSSGLFGKIEVMLSHLLQVLKDEYDIESDEGSAASASGESKDSGGNATPSVSFVATNSSDTFKVFNVQRA